MKLTSKRLWIKTSHTMTGPEGIGAESVWEAMVAIYKRQDMVHDRLCW